MATDPEFKRMIGNRESNSDGFTYNYGKFKPDNKGHGMNLSTKRSLRRDKKHVRNIHTKELHKEINEELME